MRSSSFSCGLFAVNSLCVKRASGAALIAGLALALGGGCKKEQPPAAEVEVSTGAAVAESPAEPPDDDSPYKDLSWSAVSQDGTAVLSHSANETGKCRRWCNDAPNASELWNAEGCIGEKIDLRFISNDCEKVVILHQLPKATAHAANWPQVEVGHVYTRGKLDYAVAAGGAVRNFRQIRSAGTTFYWLAGALGVPGERPRYAPDGAAVLFTTVDGTAQSIPLVSQAK